MRMGSLRSVANGRGKVMVSVRSILGGKSVIAAASGWRLIAVTTLLSVFMVGVSSPAGAISTCAGHGSNNYAMGFSTTYNAFGVEAYIPVNSPSVPAKGYTIDQHIFTISGSGQSGSEVGWLIGTERGDGGVYYGYTTSPVLFATNNDASPLSAYVEFNGPTIANGSNDYYTIWWNGSSTLSFRVNSSIGGTILWSGGWALTRNAGAAGAGSEFAPGNYVLQGKTAGSSTIGPYLYLNSANSWVPFGYPSVCADTGLSVSLNGSNLTDSGTLN